MNMMYMPDAINAAISLMEADPARLKHRNAFNIASMSFDRKMIYAAIRKHVPDFGNDLSDRSFEAGHCRQLARFAG